MKFYLLVCCAFFIPHILGTNDTTSNFEQNINSTEAVTKKVQKTTPIVTNTLITEGGTVIKGGTIIQNTPSLEDFIPVHKELGNRSHSTIVARKEAKLSDTDDYHPNSSATDSNIDEMKNQTRGKYSHLKNNTAAILSSTDIKNTTHTFVSKLDSTNSSEAVTPKQQVKIKPKKPTILSYEGLANMDLKLESKSKSHNKVSSSIPVSKILPANEHPGMIMPIVIAILVVPMFAVLGYMALRRGQEAWKNRHYKRMDFLLDGMYNE